MAVPLKRDKRVKAGAFVASGRDPRSLVEPAPVHAPFVIEGPEYIVRANGRPVVVCSGDCPRLADLEGFVLVVTFRRRGIVFGGLHPLIRDGSDAPFRQFFDLNTKERSVHTTIAAVGNIDVLVALEGGRVESFIFRFLPWLEMMSPVAKQESYRKIAGESRNGESQEEVANARL